MKTIIIIGLVVAALAGGGFAYTASMQRIPVEAAIVRESPIREYIEERGKTRLPHTYTITMPYDGRVAAIELVEGASIKQGDIVAQVVSADLELAVAAAEAAVQRIEKSIVENADASVEKTGLAQSQSFVKSMDSTVEAARERVNSGKAKLEYAESNLERTRSAKSAVTEDEIERAELAQIQAAVDYRQDQLVLRAMQAMQAATALLPTALQQYIDRKDLSGEVLDRQLAEARVRLEQEKMNQQRGVMRSPVDGVVLSKSVTNEGRVAGGTELLTIGRLEDLEVEADILSQDVVNVQIGNKVEISGPAIGPAAALGTVSRIYPAGFLKVSSLGVEQQRVKVVIGLLSSDLARLRDERHLGVDYRVRVRIYTAEKPAATVIPRSALFRGADGGWQVFVVRDGSAHLQNVEVGLSNDQSVEVTTGLHAGDTVILAPETSLTDGQRVQPMVREAAELSETNLAD